MTNQTDIQLLKKLGEIKTQFFSEISKSIIGQFKVLDHILIALLCKGHTLIVDLGKIEAILPGRFYPKAEKYHIEDRIPQNTIY